MRSLLIVVLLLSISTNAQAVEPSIEDVVKDAKSLGLSQIDKNINDAKNIDMSGMVTGYTDKPEQTKYYNEEGKESPDLQQDAAKISEQGVGKDINSSIKNRPNYKFNGNEGELQRSELIINDAYNITQGITDQYHDCKSEQTCTNTYQNEECLEVPPPTNKSCDSELNLIDYPATEVVHYPLSAHISVRKHNYAGVEVDVKTGKVKSIGPHDASFRLDGRIPTFVDCKTVKGSVISQSGNASVDTLNFPSCSNGMSLMLHIQNGHSVDVNIDITSTIIKHNYTDQWTDNCNDIKHDSYCKLVKNQCTDEKSTKVINGDPVTRECWKQSFNYVCHGDESIGTCKPLQNKGCEQINSVCNEKSTEPCKLFKQTYRCPVTQCSTTNNVVCGDGKEYCLDGNCSDTSYKSSGDFSTAVSALSAAAVSGNDIDQTTLKIFSGRSEECSKAIVGFSNCCTGKGWGQDMWLKNCTSEERSLHDARNNKLAVDVGEYCSGSKPFPCREHSRVYCVFNSRLAKIIQDQGRRGQLNMSFGSAKHPNCEGITSNQLQGIDFNKINFADYLSDISDKYKAPNLNQIKAKIENDINSMKNNGGSDGQ